LQIAVSGSQGEQAFLMSHPLRNKIGFTSSQPFLSSQVFKVHTIKIKLNYSHITLSYFRFICPSWHFNSKGDILKNQHLFFFFKSMFNESPMFLTPLTFILWTKTTETFFNISSFVLHRRKKVIEVWNDMRVSKWWQNCNFWVIYPFNSAIIN